MKRETKQGGGGDYLNKLESKTSQAAIFANISMQVQVCIDTHIDKHIRYRALSDGTHRTDTENPPLHGTFKLVNNRIQI